MAELLSQEEIDKLLGNSEEKNSEEIEREALQKELEVLDESTKNAEETIKKAMEALNESEEKKDEEKTVGEKGIPVFITNKLRNDLKSFGLKDEEINKLKPEEAWNLLEQKKESEVLKGKSKINQESLPQKLKSAKELAMEEKVAWGKKKEVGKIETKPIQEESKKTPEELKNEIALDIARKDFFNARDTKADPKTIEEKEKTYRDEKQKTLDVFLKEGEKEKAQEFLSKEVELKRKNDIENKLVGRGERFQAAVSNSIEKWDNFGKETGWKGMAKRALKMGISLTLIGAASSFSVEKLANAGIGSASALSGGATSYLARKIGMGMVIGTVMSTIPPKYKKWVGAAMMAASVGLAVSGAGAIAGATVVASSAFGYGLSNLTKRYDKKIKERAELAKNKIDFSNLENTEKEIEKILKAAETTRITGKLVEAGTALAGSMAYLEIAGFSHDYKQMESDKMQAENKIHDLKEEVNKLEHAAKIDHEKIDSLNAKIHDLEAKAGINETGTGKKVENTFKGEKIEFDHGMGGIKAIENLKAQIHHDYPDISKAPHSVQEFLKTDSNQEAIKLGFFNPNDPKGTESAMILKGSTLEFDQHGNLSFHDMKTGEDHILISEQNNTETIDKYHGKMFDSDHSATKDIHHATAEHASPANNEYEGAGKHVDNDLIMKEPTDSNAETNTGKQRIDEYEDNSLEGKMVNGHEDTSGNVTAGGHEQTTGHEDTSTAEKNAYEAGVYREDSPFNPHIFSSEEYNKLNDIYEHNLKVVSLNDPKTFEHIKLSADEIVNTDIDTVNDLYKAPISYIQELKDITGIHPMAGTALEPAETAPEFVARALQSSALHDGYIPKAWVDANEITHLEKINIEK